MMTKENALGIALFFIAISFVFLFLAGYMFYQKKKLLSLNGKTHGRVRGLVRNGLFKNVTIGDVDTRVLTGWSVSHGEQYWGGILRMSIPPWLPCIIYSVNGNEVIQISGEGTTRNKWSLGQDVTVLYDPCNPRKHIIEGDNSYDWTIAIHFGLFVVLNLVAVLFIYIYKII